MKKAPKSVVTISGPDVHHYVNITRPPKKGRAWLWVKGILVSTIVSLAESTVHKPLTTCLNGYFLGAGYPQEWVAWLTLFIPLLLVAIVTSLIMGNDIV